MTVSKMKNIEASLKGASVLWRSVLAFVSGAVMALSLPPVGVFAVLWFSFPAVFFLLKTAETRKQGFWLGWLFGFGFFLAGLYWVTFAMFVDLAAWWWFIPVALLAGPGALAFYIAVFGLSMFEVFKRFPGGAPVFMFAALWSILDFLRGVLFTGFPWNATGYAWMSSLAVSQNLSWAGVHGLGLITVLCAALPVFYMLDVAKWKKVAMPIVSVLVPLLLWGWGANRLSDVPSIPTEGQLLRVVQAHVPQKEKWDHKKQPEHLKTYFRMSGQPSKIVGQDGKTVSPAYIIWPETALTADIGSYPAVADYLRRSLPQDSVLLTGTIHGTGGDVFYNTLLALDVPSGKTAYYHKSHLVPFGEYVPFREILSFGPLGAVLSGFGEFVPGTGPYTADVFGIPSFSPLICYEIIFSGNVTSRSDERPKWILNVTNDGWYGHTSGPYQHYSFTRARAIEEGLPVVRAANTGISAVIDAYGQAVGSVGLGHAGVIDTYLPESLASTPYARYRHCFFSVGVLFLLLLSLFCKIRAKKLFEKPENS